jgi:hypothetical protein
MLHGGTACPTRTAENVAHGTQRCCSSNSWFPLRGTWPRRFQSQRAAAWTCLARCWLTSPAAALARPLSMTMARARPGWQSPVSTRAAGHGVMACDRLPAASCGIQQQGTVSFAAGRFSKPNSSVPSMRRCAFEPSFAAGHFFPSRETAPAAASINWRRCCGTFINMVANGACSARSIVLVLQRTLIGLTLDISNA